MRSICLQSSWYVPLVVSDLCTGRSSKCTNKRAKPLKLGKAKLRFLSTVLLLNEIYLHVPTNVQVITSCSFQVLSRKNSKCKKTLLKTQGKVSALCTTDGRTYRRAYGRTDKVATLCSLFRELNIFNGNKRSKNLL